MAYPKRLLNEGEEIILDMRQHWIALWLAFAWTFVIVVALVILLWLTWDVAVLRFVVIAAAVVAFGILAGFQYATWLTTYFVVTSERVISRSGVFAKRALDIPLDRINDINFRQTIVERLFGSGTLIISSASEVGNNIFKFIKDPEMVQNRIYRAREDEELRDHHQIADALRGPGTTAPAPAADASAGAPATDSPAEKIRHLAQLRDEGLISDEEFEAKKTELLNRM